MNDSSHIPFLSVITVNYNDAQGLKKTIASVLDQEFNDFEYLIIDGGSKDESKQMIEQNASCLSYWCSENDGGIYDAMNKGAQKATGEFIYFLNSGDVVYKNTFQQLAEKYEQEKNADIIYGDIRIGESSLTATGKDISLIKLDMPFCHQAAIVKREVCIGHPFDLSYRIAADYDFFLKMYRMGRNFVKTGICFGVYDTTGVSNTYYFKTIKEYLRALWINTNGLSKISTAGGYLWHKKKFIVYLLLNRILGKAFYTRIRNGLRLI